MKNFILGLILILWTPVIFGQAYTSTPNLGLKKPILGLPPVPITSSDNHGNILNSNFDLLDTLPALSGSGTATFEDIVTKGPWMDVRALGAKCDNSTDDTTSINSVLALGGTVIIPSGKHCKVLGTLILNGSVNLIGFANSSIEFYSTGNYVSTYNKVGSIDNSQIILGPVTTWTGTINGMTFNFNGTFPTTIYAMTVFSADTFDIYDNVFTGMFATTGGSGILASGNGMLQNTTATNKQLNGRIRYNTMTWNTSNTKMEASSMSLNSFNITWQGNDFSGFGDDAIALHGGSNYYILDNYINTKTGKILVESGVSRVNINGNHLVKINSSTNSAGIMINEDNSSGVNVVASNISVTNNIIINDDSTYDLVSPIELRGGLNVSVSGNILKNNRGAGTFTLKAALFTSGATTYYLEDVHINDNIVYGGNIDIFPTNVSGTPKLVLVNNNFADGKGFTAYPINLELYNSRSEYGLNNIGINGTTQNTNLTVDSGTLGGNGTLNDLITKGPWVDVRAYGAKGDGVTDDTAAINNAIAAISASGGGVYFPTGIYIITSTITLTNRTGISLIGTTRGMVGGGFNSGSIIRAGGALTNNPMIYFNGARETKISDLVIDGNANTGITGLKLDWDNSQASQNSGNHYENIVVRGQSIGTDIGNTSDYAVSELFFTNSTFLNNDTGIRVRGGNSLNIHFSNGSIAGNSQSTSIGVDMVKGDFWGTNIDASNLNIGFNVALAIDGLRITQGRFEAINQLIETTTGATSSNRVPISLVNVHCIGSSTVNYIDINANFWLYFLGTIRGGSSKINYNPGATQISNGLNQFIDMGAYPDNAPTVTSGARYISFRNFGNDAYKFIGASVSTNNQYISTLATGTAPFQTASTTSSNIYISTPTIYGTTTNDNASAGMIGEYAVTTIGTASSFTLASTTTATIATLALTAGDWEIGGTVSYTFASTTSVTNLAQGWSTTAATLGTQGTYSGEEYAAMIPTAGHDDTMVIPTGRLSLSGNANVYLVAQGTFSASSLKSYGQIWARRMR